MIDISKYIPQKNETLIVGCSTGPDSMALLHYLTNNTKNKIICCHINHNVRKESKEEEKYLKNYCKQKNIPFESYKIEKYTEKNFENEARKKRYQFYEQILNKYHAKYLFLAHHGDDLIETILMKIIRGTSLEGYAGIKKISKQKNYYIIRPFLEYTKEDLIDYNQKHNIQYYLDKSNENTTYTRNRIRKNILPLLKQENKNVHKQFLKYSTTLLEYHNYIENQIKHILPTIYQNNTLNITKFKTLDPLLQKNVLHKILIKFYENQENIINDKIINNLTNLINSPRPNININLPKNNIAKKEYNNLYLTKNKTNFHQSYKIPLQKTNTIENIIIKQIDQTKDNGNDICRLNSQNIKMPLYLRNRKDGDIIELKGTNGRKKIKEIFIEKKIPKTKRENYPILVDSDDQIIWIPNLKKSKFISQKQDFYDIILRYCEKEENNEQ